MENKKEEYDLRRQLQLDQLDPFIGQVYYLQHHGTEEELDEFLNDQYKMNKILFFVVLAIFFAIGISMIFC